MTLFTWELNKDSSKVVSISECSVKRSNSDNAVIISESKMYDF